MVTLNIGTMESSLKSGLVNTLNEIANAIDNGNTSGITTDGTCWDIDGDEDEDYY